MITASRPGDRTRVLRYAVGAVLGLAALYACVASVNWPQFVDSFRSARASWVVAALVSIPISLAVLTARWALLLDEGRSVRSWQKLWDSVVVGQAVNIVFPLRFGEGARVALTCRELGLPAGRVVIALVLERAFDTAMIAATLMLVSGGWVPRIGAADSTMVRATAVLALATVAALAGALWLLSAAGSRGRFFGRESSIGRWIDAQLVAVRQGWAGIRRPRRLAAIAALTVGGTAAATSTNLLVFHAFGLQLPWLTAVALLVVLQLGNSVVSVPGNVGVFHYLTVTVLDMLDVPPSTALAVAVVLHAISLGPKVVLGALTLAWPRAREQTVARPPG